LRNFDIGIWDGPGINFESKTEQTV
jgi:hypothetical protein